MTEPPPKNLLVGGIEISFFVHATEDLDKVIETVQTVIPEELMGEAVFERDDLRGHHGNPIISFKTTIKNKKIATALVEMLVAELREEDRGHLRQYIKEHLDRSGNLYLRMDKQAACRGEIRLGQSDPIHIRVKLGNYRTALTSLISSPHGSS